MTNKFNLDLKVQRRPRQPKSEGTVTVCPDGLEKNRKSSTLPLKIAQNEAQASFYLASGLFLIILELWAIRIGSHYFKSKDKQVVSDQIIFAKK